MRILNRLGWGRSGKCYAQRLFSPIPRTVEPSIPLAVVAIVKDEAAYLEEWIEFHAMLGVSQFVIYDNASSDGTPDLLERYRRDGLVTWYPWPNFTNDGGQVLAYAHAALVWREHCRWIAFIDVDEFLYPAHGQCLVRALGTLADFSAVEVAWRNFGHGGHQTKPNGLVTEAYRHRMGVMPPDTTPALAKQINNVKSVVDPCRVIQLKVHQPLVDGATTSGHGRLVLNHYFTRSVAEFDFKVARGYGFSKRRDIRNRTLGFRKAIEYDPVEDLEIQRLIPALKERLGRSREDVTLRASA